MEKHVSKGHKQKKSIIHRFLFIGIIFVIYGVFFVVMPDRAFIALKNTSKVFVNIIIPLIFVFILLFCINLFLKPSHIVRFLGKSSGIKGVTLSAIAGIISMGPIYAWYPMLKALREKGAKNSLIAIFLGNRAVKPFLLPIMVSYFGWIYVLILTVFTIFGSLVVGYFVDALVREKPAN